MSSKMWARARPIKGSGIKRPGRERDSESSSGQMEASMRACGPGVKQTGGAE